MKRRFLKVTAIILAINFLTITLAPTLTYALTAGPTAPEFSSFEPVDTTDMVSLSTGDFTYNIPLLEVPGPEGGYPLALSYHAGIQPDEEASWVGLGWTLNPGAINRYVNGYADDHNNVTRTVHDYWDGGERSIFTVGVGVCGVGINLQFGNDTYQGTGVGVQVAANYSLFKTDQAAIAASASLGSDPWGNVSGSIGVSAGVLIGEAENGAKSIGISAGVATNFETVTLYGGVGVSIQGASVLGASITSESLKPSISAMGTSISQVNSNAGKITTEASSFATTIPIYIFTLTLGQSYIRYYSSESSDVQTFGTLHPNHNFVPNSQSFDSYSLVDSDAPNSYRGQVDRQLGGGFPSYDNYMVTGQGIGGSIQPYIFENGPLYRQNIIAGGVNNFLLYTSESGHSFTKNVNFRFNNDFSNSLTRTEETTPGNGDNSVNGWLTATEGQFVSPTTDFANGFRNDTESHLAGSKHVKWFSNAEIKNGSAKDDGFVSHDFYATRSLTKDAPMMDESINYWGAYKTYGSGSYHGNSFGSYDGGVYGEAIKSYDISSQIGGFMITNESGVTYHYSLPVYSYDEYSKNSTSDSYRENFNPHPYAYTWLLTGVTGPDYVDRGNYGFSDDDYGYWVRFDYGMWTDSYQWRNPGIGSHKDIDKSMSFFSGGKKEIYYLDAIITRTHAALFVKEARDDAKGVSNIINGGYGHSEGGFNSFEDITSPVTNLPMCENGTTRDLDGKRYTFPTSSLKLKNIYLVKKEVLDNIGLEQLKTTNVSKTGTEALKYKPLNFTYGNVWRCCTTGTNDCVNQLHEGNIVATNRRTFINHFGNNVIDVLDLPSDFSSNIIREIEFESDNSTLCMGTDNSIPFEEIYQQTPVQYTETGKLTLKKLHFKGKQGAVVVPPLVFGYDETNPAKNPTYPSGNAHDSWGMYKSDFNATLAEQNRTLAERPTATSSQNVDAWSLKEITTSLGAKIRIEYESDEYNHVGIAQEGQPLQITSMVPQTSSGYVRLQFAGIVNFNLTPEIYLNNSVAIKSLIRHVGPSVSTLCGCPIAGLNTGNFIEYEILQEDAIIKSIGDDYIDIEKSELYNKLTIPKGQVSRNCDDYYMLFGTPVVINYADVPVVEGGMLFLKNDVGVTIKGGGIRVKTITLDDKYITDYLYEHGHTTYEPFGIEDEKFLQPNNLPCFSIYERVKKQEYKDLIRKQYSYLLSLAREIPGPGVLYQKVKVSEKVKENGTIIPVVGRKEYEFSMFDGQSNKKSVERTAPQLSQTDIDTEILAANTRLVDIKNFSSHVGSLVGIKVYGIDATTGQDRLLSEMTNTYLRDLQGITTNDLYETKLKNDYKGQGIVSQMFYEKRVNTPPGTITPLFQLQVSRKTEYPNVLISTEYQNHMTGTTNTSKNLEFDFYTGRVTKTLSTDSYGNSYITESVPAYTNYSSMGLKVITPLNKHMLTQNYKSFTYKADADNSYANLGYLGYGITTWSNQVNVSGTSTGLQSDVWRPKATYGWDSELTALNQDGTIPVSSIVAFDEQSPNAGWLKAKEITLYDPSSRILEMRDLNNNYTAMKTNPNRELVIASANLAKYDEMAYASAEFYSGNTAFEAGVDRGNGVPSTNFAHTGEFSLRIPASEKGFQYTIPSSAVTSGRKYRASVWVYMPNASETDIIANAKLYYKINGTETEVAPVITKKARSYYLIEAIITSIGSYAIEVGCKNNSTSQDAYFDDFRVCPLQSSMTSFVYDRNTHELLYTLNSDNLYTRYQYDDHGKLVRTYQEIFAAAEKPIAAMKYNYGRDKIYRVR